jgi:hypothetical protein
LVSCAGLPLGAAELEARFVDPAWDGDKVPDGQQCGRFEGEGVTPEIVVGGIPAEAEMLVLEFSDRSYEPMDNGGHGKVGYRIAAGASEVTVPSAPGHTTDLPEGFVVVAEHQAPNWDKAGAYLPPCSGGRGNAYYVTVKAVREAGGQLEELASAVLEMGKF